MTTNRFALILSHKVATGDTLFNEGVQYTVERVVIRLMRTSRPPKTVRYRICDVKGVRVFFDGGKVRELGPKDHVLVRKAA